MVSWYWYRYRCADSLPPCHGGGKGSVVIDGEEKGGGEGVSCDLWRHWVLQPRPQSPRSRAHAGGDDIHTYRAWLMRMLASEVRPATTAAMWPSIW